MPVASEIDIGQSQRGFFRSNASAYFEAALTAAGWTRNGVAERKAEIERRLPGWTVNTYGGQAAGIGLLVAGDTGAGGSAFVDDWIDPTVAPGDDTPLSGNTDARLTTGVGQIVAASVDSIIAANNAGTDVWLLNQIFQTWDIADTKGRSKVNQCRAIRLFYNFMGAKFAAAGKPYRMYIVQPGFSERSGSDYFMLALREAQEHMAVNGRRSNDPALAGFAVVPNLYLLGSANCAVSFDDAREADNVATASDRAHQSVGSSIRLARMMALGQARYLDPLVPQEYDGIPYVVNAHVKAGSPLVVRVRVKITPNNRLVWVPRPAADAGTQALEGGTAAFPTGNINMLVHAHRQYIPGAAAPFQGLRPQRIPVTAIAVDNSAAATGYAFLELTLATAPTLGTCFTIQPSQSYRQYWRQLEAIATNLKELPGLREEAGGTPYTVTAACEDVLATPGAINHTWLPVQACTNVPVAATDFGP